MKRFRALFLLFISLLSLSAPRAAYAEAFEMIERLFNIENNADPFKQPSDVAVSEDGSIFVLDGVNNRIMVFDNEGRFLYKFGKGGAGAGEFKFPLGLCLDDKNRIFIADSGNHRVQAFTLDGTYLFQIDLPTGGDKPPDPTDLIYDAHSDNLIIVDNDNHAVYTYSLRRKRIFRTTGAMGLGKTKADLRWPFTIDIDSYGYLYVVDVINTRVRALTPKGVFSINIGAWGVNRGQFFRPKGVAVDSRDRIYVTDSYLGVIQVFNREGQIISVLADESGKARRFITPVRAHIDKNDRIYVVEMFANRIGVYQKKQALR